LPILSAVVLLLLLAAAVNLTLTYARKRSTRALGNAKWDVFEFSSGGSTHVVVRLVAVGVPGAPRGQVVLETREVGQVRDDDPDYDDALLTLRAKAQQRLAIVSTE
jgi:hypothetical protein